LSSMKARRYAWIRRKARIFPERSSFGREATMKPKTLYLLLCVAGLALPYWQFVPWVAENGLNLRLFVQQLFANRIGGFFGMDVLLPALVFFFLGGAGGGGVKLRRGRWLPSLALFSVGFSLALPLYLSLRELSLKQSQGEIKTATA